MKGERASSLQHLTVLKNSNTPPGFKQQEIKLWCKAHQSTYKHLKYSQKQGWLAQTHITFSLAWYFNKPPVSVKFPF